jgi:hypothetical protein
MSTEHWSDVGTDNRHVLSGVVSKRTLPSWKLMDDADIIGVIWPNSV